MNRIRQRRVRQWRQQYQADAPARRARRILDAARAERGEGDSRFIDLSLHLASLPANQRRRIEKRSRAMVRQSRPAKRANDPVRLHYWLQLDAALDLPPSHSWIGTCLFLAETTPIGPWPDDPRELIDGTLTIICPPLRPGRPGLRTRCRRAADYWLSEPQPDFDNATAWDLIKAEGWLGMERVAAVFGGLDFPALEAWCRARGFDPEKDHD